MMQFVNCTTTPVEYFCGTLLHIVTSYHPVGIDTHPKFAEAL
jgi:hypothetical protein